MIEGPANYEFFLIVILGLDSIDSFDELQTVTAELSGFNWSRSDLLRAALKRPRSEGTGELEFWYKRCEILLMCFSSLVRDIRVAAILACTFSPCIYFLTFYLDTGLLQSS